MEKGRLESTIQSMIDSVNMPERLLSHVRKLPVPKNDVTSFIPALFVALSLRSTLLVVAVAVDWVADPFPTAAAYWSL